jgi:hypothetical protein
MIRQIILPFKLEMARHLITPHAGLALLGEFAAGLGFSRSAKRYLPTPGSSAGYRPSKCIFPLILMLNGGGRSLEGTRQIRTDEGLRKVPGIETIVYPSPKCSG